MIALATFKFARRWFAAILIILVLMSLLYAELMTTRNPFWNFYSPFSRFWELGIGALLAVRELGNADKRGGWTAQILPLAGVLLIGVSIVFLFHGSTKHPGAMTLVPILGTALVIAFGTSRGPAGWLLGNRLAVGIGLISYSAYLWHFPIFAFARLSLEYFSDLEKAAAIILSLGLSVLSYRYVEQPFRNRAFLPAKRVGQVLPIMAGVCLASTFAMAAAKVDGRANVPESALAADRVYELDNQYLLSLRKNNFGRGWEMFQENFNSSKPKILVWGDSHGFDFFQILQASKYADAYSIRSCDLRLVYFEDDKTNENYVAEAAKGQIKATETCMNSDLMEQAETVVVSDSFEPYELQYLSELIQYLQSRDKKVVVLGRSMRWSVRPQFRTFLDDIFLRNGNSLYGIDFEKEGRRFYDARRIAEDKDSDIIREIAETEGAIFLDKREYQCDLAAETCDLVTDNQRKIYSDFHHVTLEGAQHFGQKITEMDWFDID